MFQKYIWRTVVEILTVVLTCTTAFGSVRAETVFEDKFPMETVRLPTEEKERYYPDPAKWAFTFLPGSLWPGSYGNGTNWLEGNAESQTYLSATTLKIGGTTVPKELRYDPFSILPDGLHIRAGLLTEQQQKAYAVGGHRRFGSGMLRSLQSFKYGKFRIVAKLPSATGTWPAIWLLPQEFKWPPEIDILEGMAWGKHTEEQHIGIVAPHGTTGSLSKWVDVGHPLSQDFHEYGLDWDSKQLTFLFDRKIIETRPTPAFLHEPFYLLVNLAIGGKWVYNEMGLKPVNSADPSRLAAGADLIEPGLPADLIIRSVKITSNDGP